MLSHKLAIGTAQFGLDYGINNNQGQVTKENAITILKKAKDRGIDTLDTAIAYGNSEQRLGEIGLEDWQIISKLPPIPDDCPDVTRWILSAVEDSLKRLQTPKLRGLLLHQPSQLLGPNGDQIYEALLQIRESHKSSKIGISIYEPAELGPILSRYPIDIVQAPYSILDQRLIHSGWMNQFLDLGIELHVRSIFLQGLLLMETQEQIRQFPQWEPLWTRYRHWLEESGQKPLNACLSHALSCPTIHRVVVGVDSPAQLLEIFHAAESTPGPTPAELVTTDVNLLNPARWKNRIPINLT